MLRTRKFAATTIVAVASMLAAAGAAHAEGEATFEITAGSLTISVPGTATGPVNLGSVAASTALTTFTSDAFGPVTVTDARGSLVAEWEATVSSTAFTTGGATAQETVANTNIAYTALATGATTSGDGVFTGSALASLGAPGIAGAWAGVGSNEVTWTPSLTFTMLENQVAGVYSGTITHSVTAVTAATGA